MCDRIQIAGATVRAVAAARACKVERPVEPPVPTADDGFGLVSQVTTPWRQIGGFGGRVRARCWLRCRHCGGGAEVSSKAEEKNESSPAKSSSSEASPSGESRPGIGEDFQDAMPISAQLGFGTLLLEDTEHAVDAGQAAELLPLWKAARSLSESETVAEAELEAVFHQIEDTMTRKVGGVGLGLAIVKEIIGNHDGEIRAESAGRGKGSRFIFSVPVAEKV